MTDYAMGKWAILEAIGNPGPLVHLRGGGNVGDQLIWHGTRRMLRDAGLPFREVNIFDWRDLIEPGDTVLVMGTGGWCHPFHAMPELLAGLEERCQRMIILPSSFDPAAPGVSEFLAATRAVIFCRERISYELIKPLCRRPALAHDCALYFDYSPWRCAPRADVLRAYRTDCESMGEPIPADNEDISLTTPRLDDWLYKIATHRLIYTDRAHVMIAAHMLGRQVCWWPGNYHKIQGIAEYSIQESADVRGSVNSAPISV